MRKVLYITTTYRSKTFVCSKVVLSRIFTSLIDWFVILLICKHYITLHYSGAVTRVNSGLPSKYRTSGSLLNLTLRHYTHTQNTHTHIDRWLLPSVSPQSSIHREYYTRTHTHTHIHSRLLSVVNQRHMCWLLLLDIQLSRCNFDVPLEPFGRSAFN